MSHGVLLIDKPLGQSSAAIVAVARRALGTRKVGHAGTLDPMATGLLVLALGEGLKVVRYLLVDDKRYEAVVRMGTETDTLDADGKVVEERALPPDLTLARVREVARQFEGPTMQRAPVVSALKRDGVPLYERARRGECVEPPERLVQLHALEIRAVNGSEIELDVHCGKGFYVRSLARDLARALGTVGHLAALRRVQSGRFQVAQSVGFEALHAAAQGDQRQRAALQHAVLPIERALDHVPCFTLDAEGAACALHGRTIAREHVLPARAEHEPLEPVLLCDETGKLLAVGRSSESGLQVVRGFRGLYG